MNAFLDGVSAWLGDFYLLATVVLAAALVARLVIRRPGPRVAMAWGTWLGLAAIALLTALPAWPRYTYSELAELWQPAPAVVAAPPVIVPAEAIATGAAIEELPIALDVAFPVERETVAFDRPPFPWTWNQLAAAAWLVAAGLAVGWIILGAARARRLLSRASKVAEWVQHELQRIVLSAADRRLPGVRTSPDVATAVALRALRPLIVLPQSCVDKASAPAVRAALAHEWAHIRHGDLWLLALERLLLPLLAAHPLFWWLRRSVRLDQELLADAAAAGQQPVEYAEALLAWAKSAKSAPHGLAALAMWENPNTLSRRVSMILDPKVPAARPVSRGWLLVLLAVALPTSAGLSLVTLRPLTAQEPAAAVDEAEEVEPQPPAVLNEKTYRELPAARTVPVTKIQMDLLLLSVNREKLAAADTSLEDAIQAATESRCRREAGLIVADVVESEIKSLLAALKKQDAFTIISRPSVITLDGREATVHVGGEAPILRVEETINGKHERRVEYKEFGTMLMVRPKLDADEKEEFIRLDIVAEQANLLPAGEAVEAGTVPRDVPGLVSHKFKLTAAVKLGGSLLVAESPADKKQLRAAVKEQFVVIVTPQRAVREAVAVYANPQEGEKAEAARTAAAAEPEPGSAAAALLKRERDLRAKETAELQRRIEMLERALAERQGEAGKSPGTLKDDVQFLPPAPERKPQLLEARAFRLSKGDARQHKARFDELLARSPLAGQKFAVNFKGEIAEVYAPAELMGEVRKLLVALGAEEIAAGRATERPATAAGPPTRTVDQQLFELDLRVAELALEKAEKDYDRIAQLAKDGQISQEQVDAARYALAVAKIEVQRAKARLEATSPPVASPPAAEAARSERASSSKETELKLLELDLAEAKLAVEEAEEELSRVQQLRENNAISQQEVRQKQLAVERAKIQLQRIMVKLEGVRDVLRATR